MRAVTRTLGSFRLWPVFIYRNRPKRNPLTNSIIVNTGMNAPVGFIRKDMISAMAAITPPANGPYSAAPTYTEIKLRLNLMASPMRRYPEIADSIRVIATSIAIKHRSLVESFLKLRLFLNIKNTPFLKNFRGCYIKIRFECNSG